MTRERIFEHTVWVLFVTLCFVFTFHHRVIGWFMRFCRFCDEIFESFGT